ncbi:archaemetzincin [Pelagicoccus mobilis]|uniref:Archaemetzincin n=1 Tax=Pelagicoccus mobilis TaxID=415221 RepID=A0A934S2H4_9BACT|nr:archaemetzincin [Pelagicoccus mobilis]MBK1879436.1 hypothetical protein [Pelagicoccus mobilis]
MKLLPLLLPALLTLHLAAAPDFHPPSVVKQLEAVGPTDEFTPTERILFLDTEEFTTIPDPGPIDWLSSHIERGQTCSRFLQEDYAKPTDSTYLYLQPIGVSDLPIEFQELLIKYCSAFFDTKVKLLETMPIDTRLISTRINQFTGKRQLNAADILEVLKVQKPNDAYAVIAFTTTDLYPQETWNFVFGLANLRESVGVFSIARYGNLASEPKLYTERALKVMTHEIGHMYGIKHCIYYHCLMNGSNHLEETDAAPMHLCPVCLRKLDLSVKPDHLMRYTRLKKIYQHENLEPPAEFTKKRVRKLISSSLESSL